MAVTVALQYVCVQSACILRNYASIACINVLYAQYACIMRVRWILQIMFANRHNRSERVGPYNGQIRARSALAGCFVASEIGIAKAKNFTHLCRVADERLQHEVGGEVHVGHNAAQPLVASAGPPCNLPSEHAKLKEKVEALATSPV